MALHGAFAHRRTQDIDCNAVFVFLSFFLFLCSWVDTMWIAVDVDSSNDCGALSGLPADVVVLVLAFLSSSWRIGTRLTWNQLTNV